MVKYKITVDTGVPYDIDVNSDKELKKELMKLKKEVQDNPDDYPYAETNVYDENDNDVTDKMFKKLKIME